MAESPTPTLRPTIIPLTVISWDGHELAFGNADAAPVAELLTITLPVGEAVTVTVLVAVATTA